MEEADSKVKKTSDLPALWLLTSVRHCDCAHHAY